MASFPPRNEEGGFATPAAMMVCLLVASLATALLANSLAYLQIARRQLEREQTEIALNGAHSLAIATLVASNGAAPFQWQAETATGTVQIRAEPEGGKLSLAALADLKSEQLTELGIADAGVLSDDIARAKRDGDELDIRKLSPSPIWRECAPTMVTAFGGRAEWRYQPPAVPEPKPTSNVWRIGEVWRIGVEDKNDWRDERIVRFTGDPLHPAATIQRTLYRHTQKGEPCGEVLARLGAG